MTDTETAMRTELRDVLGHADYPVYNQTEILRALPDGAHTTFEAGDLDLTAVELAITLKDHQDFPYETLDDIVDDIIAAMHDKNLL